jgi:hypothetical protein
MNTSTKIAVAVIGGYVLGRRKKVKMALLLGSVLAGRRLGVLPLGREALGRIADSKEFGQIRDEVRNELVSTSRAAAGAVMSAPLDRLSDNLHQRTAKLTGASEDEDEEAPDGKAKQQETGQQEQEQDEASEPESRGEESGEPESEREEEAGPQRRSTPRPRRPSDRMSRTRARRTPSGAGSRGSRE